MPWATFAADFTWVTRGGATEVDYRAGERRNLTREAHAAALAKGVLQPAESGEDAEASAETESA